MNAGRDVEQVIASWLVDEAGVASPDRLLESSRRAVDRTSQRRFAAMWREPMVSPLRIGAIAAMLVIALVAGGFIGRVTAPTSPGAPATTPTPSAAGPTIEAYRAARNAICIDYGTRMDPLKAAVIGLYEAGLPATERAAKAQALADIAVQASRMTDEIKALEPPPAAFADHVTQVANLRQTVRMIQEAVGKIGAGDLVGAEALDRATDPLSADIAAFEAKYSLAACP